MIIFDREAGPAAKLLLFMPGTGDSPTDPDEFLALAATLGYRVVSLSYNNRPPVAAVCPKDPDADCSSKFRRKRLFAEDMTARIDDKPEESIVHRLVTLLAALDKKHPDENWRRYLEGDAPRWDRIAVAGHSQGAGMAAFVAQRKTVARVVLLSGPEDSYGGRDAERLAPWIRDGHGVTPAALWFAAYHADESRGPQIALAYQALNVPEPNVRILARDSAERLRNDHYHRSVVLSRETPRAEPHTRVIGDFCCGHPTDATVHSERLGGTNHASHASRMPGCGGTYRRSTLSAQRCRVTDTGLQRPTHQRESGVGQLLDLDRWTKSDPR